MCRCGDYSNNAYRIVLQPVGTVPLGEPSSLAAYIAEGDRLVKLDDAQVIARVTTPDKGTLKLEMRDDGTGGGPGLPADGNLSRASALPVHGRGLPGPARALVGRLQPQPHIVRELPGREVPEHPGRSHGDTGPGAWGAYAHRRRARTHRQRAVFGSLRKR